MGSEDEHWAHEWARSQAVEFGKSVRWRRTTSGATLGFAGAHVVKISAPRVDRAGLARRLRAAAGPALARSLVAPVTTSIGTTPRERRAVTLWPRVVVLDPAVTERLPWDQFGAQLAELHRAESAPGVRHVGSARVRRSLDRIAGRSPQLHALGRRLVGEVDSTPARDTGCVHGDWHLGQLARTEDGWRLLDVEDLGGGDGAWDLGRPAGFWAAGLLADEDWGAFLPGYRSAEGPGVPPAGDPWPALDLPARCAVFVAAARAVAEPRTTDELDRAALLSACVRMAGSTP